jgi:hypothetical protein
MGFWDTVKKQFWGWKLVFNLIWHGGHIGLFALGWYIPVFIAYVSRERLTLCIGLNSKMIQGLLV